MGLSDHEFDRVPGVEVRQPATPEGERAQRYLTDARFYYLVNRLRNGVQAGVFTADDVQEAMLVVEALEQQRKQRVAAGLEPAGQADDATGDHVRGKRSDGNAETERGAHENGQPEPGGPGGDVSR